MSETADYLNSLFPHTADAWQSRCVSAEKELAEMTAERDELRAQIGMKQDALNSYAEFYDKISRTLGYGDVLPGSAVDDAIIMHLLDGKRLQAELVEATRDGERLREALQKIAKRANSINSKHYIGDVARAALGEVKP